MVVVMVIVEWWNMVVMYVMLCEWFVWCVDVVLMVKMVDVNVKWLGEIEVKIEDVKENFGDVEIWDVMCEWVEFYVSVGEMEKSEWVYEEMEVKTALIG